MSTYVLMKFLESSASRYDRWIGRLTFGRLDRLQQHMAELIQPGQRLLEIGCGTGTFCLLAARQGATVKGIDISGEMLAAARKKVAEAGLSGRVVLEEKGVAELDQEPDSSYDAIVASLVLSELSPEEQDYALRAAFRLLRPGGTLLLVDEVKPPNPLIRVALAPIRPLLQILTFLLTGNVSRPVADLARRLEMMGFRIVSFETHNAGTLAFAVCQRPTG